ncbi:CmcJ/NvfI family oxidoreductase [Novosphingobium malaysiense]|uniref:CmcJ/NvfI family oxidoreductase n=1 Tax=Novosphingobium malaysiense TaxID=1348853 RepID=UPI00069174F2|nr:CmcJ/NvfI family oxidoreductase [Novosphingobium malaysiense]
MTAAETLGDTQAQINFAASRDEGGIWSNLDKSLITQPLKAQSIPLRDCSSVAEPPSLEREGFEWHRLAFSGADWRNPEWVETIGSPRTMEYIHERTGAAHIAPFHGHMALIRDTGDPAQPTAAEFVHLDHSRTSALPFIERSAPEDTRARYPHVRIYNVWRALTPPPHDMPLAICDQRTIDPADWVEGKTVEPMMPEGVPYVTTVFNPGQRWNWFSGLTPDDALVFKAWDSDPSVPFGCLHGAFRNPHAPAHAVPRASAELRYIAFFES